METIEEREIELHSEEVQEILGHVPSWILRWGISFLAGLVAILLMGSWMFKYPEIISAPLVLTTSTPPASIVAKTNGKINKLNYKDQELVEAGDCIGIIESPANYYDVLFLKNELLKILSKIINEEEYYFTQKELKLGGIQNTFSNFTINLESYNQFISLNYYPDKIISIREMIIAKLNHYDSMFKQYEIIIKQHDLQKKSFFRDNYLKEQGVISESEKESAYNKLLQSELSVQNMNATLKVLKINISQLENELVDIKQQYLEKKESLLSGLKAAINQLDTEIRTWELMYVLSAPINGKITFTNYWAANQNVAIGDVVFTVVPENQKELLGKALLPISGSGKVKVGQKVNIHFNNYPDNEFGIVLGRISRISLIPNNEGSYVAEVEFPNHLITSYGKKLPLSQEMTATADIVTEDQRLLEQFFLPIKKIIKNRM